MFIFTTRILHNTVLSWSCGLLLLLLQICQHKHASLFAGPVSEAEAPEYKEVVLNPVDLATIKKSIESGAIRYNNRIIQARESKYWVS
jgi:hypothetical protein